MGLRRRSVRLRVALLVLVPLLFLASFFAYSVVTSASAALTLSRSRAMMERLGPPVTALQRAISQERAQAIVYYDKPTAGGLSSLEGLQAATDRARAAFQIAAQSSAVRQGATPDERKAIAVLFKQLSELPAVRTAIPTRSDGEDRIFAAYNGLIAASYQVLEQAILAEGDLSQVLPGIAVVELAISGDYVQQESVLVNGDIAARRFPVDDQQTVLSLVGAHRLLYAQSLQYLSQADRADLQRDVSPQAAAALTALESSLARHTSPLRPPPVRPGRWNTAVASYTAGIARAVSQSQARLAAAAAAKAQAKSRTLYLTAILGMTAVIVSLGISLALAGNLTRQLAGLRDSALRLAEVQLPDVVRRLRAGQDVDVAAEVPPLATGPDEIGQVKAAFNAAQRTAVEAAVDEAKVRRAVNDVFRSLARRSQSLLHRQMALLDRLERRESDPDSLESLYRIDHLTTRMRRHAESLIVLAGESPKRAWRKPVPFVDVLRAAAAEVEDYARIKVATTSKAALAGPAVADVIHLVAELAENATLYSPQNTTVTMTGELVGNGFAIEITDRGLGLSEDELAELNSRLADPPAFDLSGSDQLGIFVAAQLAKRHGIHASLTGSPYGGVTAVVLISQTLVIAPGAAETEEDPGDPDRRNAASNGAAPQIGARTGAAPQIGARTGAAAPRNGHPVVTARHAFPPDLAAAGMAPPAAGGMAPRAAAGPSPRASVPPLPEATAAPSSPEGATGPASPEAGARPARPAGPAHHAAPRRPADAARGAHPPDAAPQERRVPPTGAGGVADQPRPAQHRLPQRVRQASLAPQLRGGRPAAAAETDSGARDPETARTVMSAFQRGWRAGLDEQAPAADPPI